MKNQIFLALDVLNKMSDTIQIGDEFGVDYGASVCDVC
jgi:hypothetical protein